MRTSDMFRLACLFLARRKTRTFLTVLGVVIGTTCIVLMLSIGVSNYSELQEMIEGNSVLTEIRVTEERADLTAQDAADIESLAHVLAASPVLLIPGRLTTGRYEAYTQLTGVYPEVLELKLAEGALFAEDTAASELIIGGNAARDFVDPDNPPDYEDFEAYDAYEPQINWLTAEFTFHFGYGGEPEEEGSNTRPWLEDPGVMMTVCGLTERSGGAGSYSIYTPLDAARRILMDNAEQAETAGISLNRFSEILVRADSMDNVSGILAEIRSMGFEASGDIEYINEMRAEQSRQLLQLLMIGLISLIVSAIGIANTMYAGILERRRDIGVMKVLGMSRGRIKSLFVAEAAVIGAAGGFAGLGISWAAIWFINAGMTSGTMAGMYFTEGSHISIPAWIGAGAILIALLTGILAGLWPAAKAARMSAVEAMRT